MPTVILVDVSLSMARPVQVQDSGESYTRLQLAVHGINTLLDYFAVYYKLEFVSLITFSSLYDIVCPFTRDFESIKQKLQNLEEQDKACIESVLHTVNRHVLNEWGSSTPCHVILVTDGNTGIGTSSTRNFAEALPNLARAPLPFAFPGKLSTLLIASSADPQLSSNLSVYKKLSDAASGDGSVHIPESVLSILSVQNMVRKMAEIEFASYQGLLCCGALSSKITLCPHPQPFTQNRDFGSRTYTLSDRIDVAGFLDLTDVGSPAAVSRHLVLPISAGISAHNHHTNSDSKIDDSDDEIHDEGKTPSFCVLLHGSLKVENMAALCVLADGWYGVLYSWADNKKKSNLMLTILEPGSDAVPWLGDLEQLGSIDDALATGDADEVTVVPTFPVRPAEKRSYSQNTVVWIRQSGLHSDIQKILRNARKLPEKTQHFYKELNRVRKAAIQFGFLELLEGLAMIFDRECTLLPDKAHPDCALQLTHCAKVLRKPESREIKNTIVALRTSFLGDD